MRLLKSILAVLTARWFLTLVGTVLLALLVWYYGPLVAVGEQRPLESETTRLLVILGLSVLWGVGNLWAQHRARRANAKLVEALVAPPPAAVAGPADAELAELATKFQAALDRLKGTRFAGQLGRRWLYELPWYLMIGPPGSGKTTALLQSGLRFPLADAAGGPELRGVGGTRNCDWLFTDEAVLIDTAGRYTTRESDVVATEAAWLGFLDLLKRFRPRQPINGVLVAVSVPDLLDPRPGAIDELARAVRARVTELSTRLGLRLPVYLVLTKADLVAGFVEAMGDLDEKAREQVFGATLPLGPEAADPARIEGELRLLVERLERRVLPKLEAENDLERRARLLEFPSQVAALGPALGRFVAAAFAGSAYQTPPVFRGFYITSATQEGTPIDRLLQSLAQSFAVRVPPPRAQRGNRSFFLTRLLRDVVFAEAPLVARDSRLVRRERWQLIGVTAGAAVILLAAGGAFFWTYRGSLAAVERFADGAHRLVQSAIGVAVPAVGRAEEDLRPVAPRLDAARTLLAQAEAAPGPVGGLGLSSRGDLAAAAEAAYDRLLERVFLPRLVRRAETRIAGELPTPQALRASLKAYLHLGSQRPWQKEEVARWLADDWKRAYPLEDELRATLAAHADVLLDRLPEYATPALDAALVQEALTALGRIPLADRVYATLKEQLAGKAPDWLPLEHAGAGGGQVLARRSGQPINTPVPGLFTRKGFHEVVLPEIEGIARNALAEDAALRPGAPPPREVEVDRVVQDVLTLYYREYTSRWRALLDDVTIVRPSSLEQAAALTRALAGPPSPLKLFLESIVAETRLTRPPEPQGAAAAAAGAQAAATAAAGRVGGGTGAALAGRLFGSGGPPPGQPVEDEPRFKELIPLVESVGGAPPRLDPVLSAVGTLDAALQQVVTSPDKAKALAGAGGLVAQIETLRNAVKTLPPPVASGLDGMAQQVKGITSGGVLRQLNEVWRADVLPRCTAMIGNRFPFVRGSPDDVTMADLKTLFAAGGLIDRFIEQQLAPHIDTAQRPWRWLPGIPGDAGSLATIETARRIRDGFFAGGATPSAGFTLKPLDLDPRSGRVVLEIDGARIEYAHGPAQPQHVDWPPPQGGRVARLTLVPLGGGVPVIVSREGPWAWLRLLEEARPQPQGRPELYRVTFTAGGQSATFELLADSVDNPFGLRLFAGFRCPGGL